MSQPLPYIELAAALWRLSGAMNYEDEANSRMLDQAARIVHAGARKDAALAEAAELVRRIVAITSDDSDLRHDATKWLDLYGKEGN